MQQLSGEQLILYTDFIKETLGLRYQRFRQFVSDTPKVLSRCQETLFKKTKHEISLKRIKKGTIYIKYSVF